MTGFSTAIVAQCITDWQFKFLEADARFLDIVQRELPELRQLDVLALTHEEDRAPNNQHLDRLRERGEAFVITKRYLLPDQTTRWVRNHVSVQRDGARGPMLLATIEAIEPPPLRPRPLVEVANRVLRRRAVRCGQFSDDIFSDPAADILVDLYASEQVDRVVDVSSASIASHATQTTAIRHLAQLEKRGMIARFADPKDKRRALLKLTDNGRETTQALLRAIERAESD